MRRTNSLPRTPLVSDKYVLLATGVGDERAQRPTASERPPSGTVAALLRMLHSTFTGMNNAGFFLGMSTTCAYFAVMRGSAWPKKSCTARRSPVCKYPSVPAVCRRA
jgi:hypothetical protein